MEKKTAHLACTTIEEVKRGLQGLANMNGVSLSEYQERLFIEHLEIKKSEARLMAEALGFKLNDI